jgi:formylglycine-generating enzyme required for sulfatase activity
LWLPSGVLFSQLEWQQLAIPLILISLAAKAKSGQPEFLKGTMRLNELSIVLVAGIALLAANSSRAQSVNIALSQVGDADNAPDNNAGANGEVNYDYSIGTFDVTLAQYCVFLNNVAKTDTYSLYNSALATAGNYSGQNTGAGIMQTGNPGSFSYSVIGTSGNDPVTYVSWLDAARFCNWLQNGQPSSGVENSSTTENGAYTLNGDTTSGLETRNSNAVWWIPSENEWYKAAYYDPALNNGSGGYYLYATKSDTPPGNNYLNPNLANQANYIGSNGLYSVTQSSSYSISQNYLTPVGSFVNSGSFFGTYDQNGEVLQWNDDNVGSDKATWSSLWSYGSDSSYSLQASFRDPSSEYAYIGFRVASIPEPNSVSQAYTIDPSTQTTNGVWYLANMDVQEPTSPPACTWRHTVGVGEQIRLTLQGLPPDISGSAQWTAGGGTIQNGVGGPVVQTGSGVQITYTAGTTAGNATVTATLVGGAQMATSFAITAPTSITATYISSEPFTTGTVGAGMFVYWTVLPTNVSFGNLMISESSCQAINVTGFYRNSPYPLMHNPSGTSYSNPSQDVGLNSYNWQIVRSDNVAPTDDHGSDWCSSGPLSIATNFGGTLSGGFEWDIPFVWKLQSDTQNTNVTLFPTTVKATVSVNNSGTVTVTKANASDTRSSNGSESHVTGP